jgi:hypothetical protein
MVKNSKRNEEEKMSLLITLMDNFFDININIIVITYYLITLMDKLEYKYYCHYILSDNING